MFRGKRTTVPTFTATIYVGLKIRSEWVKDSPSFSLGHVERICRDYCDEPGWCVTITPLRYVYTGGAEGGAAVGIINYGRFPVPENEIIRRTRELAVRLRDGLRQLQVSIVFPAGTEWLPVEESHGGVR